MENRSSDSLLLDILQRVAGLQSTVERLSHDRDRAAEMLVTVAQLTQTVDRLAPIVESLDKQRQQAIGVIWFGRIFWSLIGGGVITMVGWLAHKLGTH